VDGFVQLAKICMLDVLLLHNGSVHIFIRRFVSVVDSLYLKNNRQHPACRERYTSPPDRSVAFWLIKSSDHVFN
jgi:hypothetical protein